MKKKIFALLLLAVFINQWRPAFDWTINSNEISFPLSKNPEESTVLIIRNKSLLLRNLPNTKNFNYVILKLVGEQGDLPLKKAKKGRGDVIFNLNNVPNGSYYIEIYSASEKYTSYLSYIPGKSICIQVSDSLINFNEPPSLAKNRDIFETNDIDSATLNNYLMPSLKVQSDHPIIKEYAKTITEEFSTNYDKIKAVHDWVSSNIWYDYDELNSGIYNDKSVIDTFVSRRGVCVDFASLTAAFLRSIGIPTKLVVGYVLDSSARENWTEDLISNNKCNHVWNEAYADGRWIIIDTTCDTNNIYKNKVFSIGTGMKNRKYFDITIEFLSIDRYIVPIKYDTVSE